jgi:hypothetical protein
MLPRARILNIHSYHLKSQRYQTAPGESFYGWRQVKQLSCEYYEEYFLGHEDSAGVGSAEFFVGGGREIG